MDKPIGTDETTAAWNKIAPGYDGAVTLTHMWLGNEGLQRAGLRAGMSFLDVAAGTGALSIPAARIGAQVVATELSPVMLELLQERSRNEGLKIDTRVMDAQALELDNDTFDMVGSQFGVMLIPNMPKGISELVRVVKPGGRVLMHVYGDPHQIDFLGFLVHAVQSVRPDFIGLPTNPPPLEFRLADPKTLREELSAAGLEDVNVERITERIEFHDGRALWEWIISSNPIVERILGGMLNLTSKEREAVPASA